MCDGMQPGPAGDSSASSTYTTTDVKRSHSSAGGDTQADFTRSSIQGNAVRGQFISRIVTVPKKHGSCRPVVNLKPLNQYIIVNKRFKVDNISMVKSIIQKGDWIVSVDLKDAYLSLRQRQ